MSTTRSAMDGGAPPRPTKPAPERTGPIRAWQGLAPPPDPDRAAGAASAAGEPEPEGPAQGVASGYRVIDDYLKQGREAAARLGLGAAEGLGAAGSFQALTARLMQDGLVWLEQLARLAAVPAQEPDGAAGVGGPEAGQGRIRVRVASRRPAEVDLRLHTPAAAGSFGVHPLRAPDPALPAIDDVRLEQRGGTWLLCVHVADQQPAGLYTGVVFDRRDGSVQGTLAVRIGDEESEA